MRIIYTEVDHSKQRYDTVGDWLFYGPEMLYIYVSKLPDPRMMQAVMLHEITEALLCRAHSVKEEDVMAFDLAFEAARLDGDDTREPGDDPAAPYHNEHRDATAVERIFAMSVGLDWDEYTRAVDSLVWEPNKEL